MKINKNIIFGKNILQSSKVCHGLSSMRSKVSTYTRYCGLTQKGKCLLLAPEKLRDISVMDIYSFYDDLREKLSQSRPTFAPNETCRRLLKDGYKTRNCSPYRRWAWGQSIL
ncbi:hypothetical protein [Ruminococcus sp.]|uniref:hypothetical protein n=1 Tax=Ruminococcus sp. TaxID=41978 RepID=UPI0039A2CC0F